VVRGDTASNGRVACRQIKEAFSWVSVPTYLIRDNDAAYGHVFRNRLGAMGFETDPPRQNGYVEPLIGTLRRECLDQMLILGETHLRQIHSRSLVYRPDQGASSSICADLIYDRHRTSV
jgi:hypothetical protein